MMPLSLIGGLMRLQDYKKFITTAFVNNTRRGFADWRDCGSLCRDVVDCLEGAKDLLCAENRYEDLFKLCNWTYMKWSNTDKDDSNGETQDFCACAYAIWETIYNDGEQFLAHNKMLDTLLEHLDGRVYGCMEDTIYDFVLRHFKSEEELAKKEWERKWEELLTKFKGKLIAINSWLYIEGRYDLIMDNAEPDHDYVIDTYGKKLLKLYPQRCLKVLANAADRQAKNSKNRCDYKYIAKTLKKIAAQPG